MPDIGELVVGAWLTQVEGYDFVVYNQRPGRDLPSEPGLTGVSTRLAELDVIGMHTANGKSYVAEVTTHLDGLLYGAGVEGSLQKLRSKFAASGAYANILEERTSLEAALALWSPKVPKGVIAGVASIEEAAGRSVEIVANEAYADRVAQLIDVASQSTTSTGNDFYRALQLLTHLARSPFVELPKATVSKVRDAAAQLVSSGVLLTWNDVQKIHRTQAGIRAPRGRSEASIICNTGAHGPYPDRFLRPDLLRYVGRGFEGDQTLDRDNESLRLAIQRGIPIRVFEQLAKNKYIDHGFWEGLGDPLWHLDPDQSRRLIVYTLRRL